MCKQGGTVIRHKPPIHHLLPDNKIRTSSIMCDCVNTPKIKTDSELPTEIWYEVALFIPLSERLPLMCTSKNVCSGVLHGIDYGTHRNLAIRYAAAHNQIAVVTQLLNKEEVDPADIDNEALFQAAFNGHASMCQILLSDPRVSVAAHEHHALKTAIRRNHLKATQILLEHSTLSLSEASFLLPLAVLTRDPIMFLLVSYRAKVIHNNQQVTRDELLRSAQANVLTAVILYDCSAIFEILIDWIIERLNQLHGFTTTQLLTLVHQLALDDQEKMLRVLLELHLDDLPPSVAYYMFKWCLRKKDADFCLELLEVHGANMMVFLREEKYLVFFACYEHGLFDVAAALSHTLEAKND